MIINSIPAYERMYETSESLMKDWYDGKDFKIACGPYFSIRDVPQLRAQGYHSIRFSAWTYRPNDLRQLLISIEL